MLVIGIDPGLHGGIAFRKNEAMRVEPLPTFKISKGNGSRQILNLTDLAAMIDDQTKDESKVQVFLEYVSSSPQMGVTSAFNFGEGFGAIKGIIAAYFLPITLVTPVVWKRALKVSKNKDDSRNRASQLMPTYAHHWARHKDDGLAEAAMIALYGQQYGVIK
jgi:crossover junction endodeoxyribonuclease RuvC